MTNQDNEGSTYSVSEVQPCLADNKKVRIIAEFNVDLTPILEILFLHLRNANYSKNLACVTTKMAGQTTTVFGSGRVAMTYLRDEQEAIDKLKELSDVFSRASAYLKVNGPVSPGLVEGKENLNAIQIHKLLPKTDCGDCNESGCFAFAVLLMNGERDIDDCGPLKLRENADRREELVRLIQPINLNTVRKKRSDLEELLGLRG